MKRGSASATAKVIAASTLLLASDPSTRHLAARDAVPWCERFLSLSAGDRLLRASAVHPVSRALWRVLERGTHPGIINHYALRKHWIEAQCVDGIGQGVERVIVIGAGLDTLALRLAPLHPNVQWIEIDHPDTQAVKLEALNRLTATRSENLVFHAIDLNTMPLPPPLLHDPRSTLVILEGLLMYLPPERVASLLSQQIKALSSQAVRVVFSYMVRWPTGRAGFRPASRWIDAWLAWRKEKFLWTLPPSELAAWLDARGFALQAHAEPPFGASLAMAERALQGEQLVMAVAV